MKLLKIICCLLSPLMVGLIVESCDMNGDKCEYYTYYSCSVSSLGLAQVENLGDQQGPATVENRPVLKEYYGVNMSFDVESHEDSSKQVAKVRHFIQSAYADAPQCYFFYARDSLTSLQVFSNKDFVTSDSVSTDVTDNFKVWGWGGQHISIAQFLNQTPYSYTTLSFSCLLLSPPAAAGTYTFTVVAQLSDGRKLEQSIEAVLR